jgi:hypothetical protein
VSPVVIKEIIYHPHPVLPSLFQPDGEHKMNGNHKVPYIDKVGGELRIPVSPQALHETYQEGQDGEKVIPSPILSRAAHRPGFLSSRVVS